MQKQRLAVLWGGAVVSGVVTGLLLASCFNASLHLQPSSPLISETTNQTTIDTQTTHVMSFERVYDSLSFAEMTDSADGIVVGKVTNISQVQWNQDSGEYWGAEPGDGMAARPLRYITVNVVKPIVEFDNMGESLKITTLADSVVLDEKNNVINQEEMEQGLRVSEQVVVFIRQTELGWRDGTRPATMLMGTPVQSYFKLGEDGLYHGELLKEPLDEETLIQKILDERSSPASKP